MFSLLYVDDEPDLLEIGRLFLESTGEFEVSTVESGEDALTRLAQTDFDAIVSDYQMPGLTGIELLKSVRKSYPDIPFILFTGKGREEVVIEAIDNGADFYLQKGGDPRSQFAELSHKIRQAIGRKRAEKALSDSEKRLADIINFLPDATFAIDTDGQVIAWNRAIEEMTGISAPDILGKGNYEYAIPFYGNRRPILIDLILEPDDIVLHYYSNIHREETTLSAETNLPHPKGERITVLAKVSPLYNRNGDIVGAIESIRDITELKRTEEELRTLNEQLSASDEELRSQLDEIVTAQQEREKSEENFRTLVDNAPDAMYIQTNNRFMYLNNAALRLLGASSPDQLLGMNTFDRIHPSFHERIRERVQDLTVDKKPVGLLEEVYLKLDGTPVDVEATAVPLQYLGEQGSLVTVRDITVRKRADAEIRAAYEQLQAAEEELRAQYETLAQSEKLIRASEGRLRYMLGFYELAGGNQQDLMDYAVEGAGAVTESPLGYLAFLNEDESELTMYSWSKSAMKECTLREKPLVYKTEKTGLWGEPVRQRQPVITNDYAAPGPMKKGYPEGHPQIVRHMSVPVIDNGRVVLVAGVANKPGDYTERDVKNLQLMVQGLWQVLKRKQTEAALIENEARFRSIFDNSPYPIVINDRVTRKYVAVNAAFLRETGYTLEEVLGKDALELGTIPPEDQERLIMLHRTRSRVDQEPITLIAKDGKKSHILISALPVMLHNEPAILTMTANITELERTRNELEVRQRQMEEIASTIPGVVYQYYIRSDGTSGFYYVNLKSGAEIFGADATITDFLGWFTGHVHEDDRSRFVESNASAARERVPWNFEGRFVKSSGEEIWFQGVSCPVVHENELVFTGLLADITERKQNELRLQAMNEQLAAAEEELREQYSSLAKSGDALKESEEKYRLLVEVTGTGYVILDEEGRVIDANPAYVRLTGWTDRSEIIGRSVLEWTQESERGKNEASVRQCVRDGIIKDFEINYVDVTGRIVPVEINAAVVHEGGKVRIIALTRDISGRKATERALRTSESQYRTLVENSHDIIFTLDNEGIFTFVSPSVTALLGYAPSEMIGKSYRRFVHPDDVPVCETYIAKAVEKGDIRADVEYRIFHADGSIRIQISNISQVYDDGGSVLFMVGTARDVTDLKRSETAIRETSRKLNLLNSITRHDVANQLTTLMGYTQLAMMKKPDPVITDFLAKIENSAQVIQRQIDFTRAYQELGERAPAWQRIGDLVRAAEPKNIRVTCTCDAFEMYADPMLAKVFFNLFDNAVRHGEHVTDIAVRCETAGDDMVVFIEDNGVGIPLDEKPKLFQKGYGRNTGFGLFLAREILAITGISINETGVHGRGARFEITVPKGTYRSVS